MPPMLQGLGNEEVLASGSVVISLYAHSGLERSRWGGQWEFALCDAYF